jgi:hypothetical protein
MRPCSYPSVSPAFSQLAAKHQIHRTAVAAILERSGIVRHGKGPAGEDMAIAAELNRAGTSTSAIGLRLGFSAETIRNRLISSDISVQALMNGDD